MRLLSVEKVKNAVIIRWEKSSRGVFSSSTDDGKERLSGVFVV